MLQFDNETEELFKKYESELDKNKEPYNNVKNKISELRMKSNELERSLEFAFLLKCKYSNGMFPSERVVSFRGKSNGKCNSCFVNAGDVSPINLEYGLVKVQLYEHDNSQALIGINDTGDYTISRFVVPFEDLISRFK